MSEDPLRVRYLARCGADEIEARAEALALEQTVELPRAAVRDPRIVAEILPRVAPPVETEAGWRIEIDYPASLAGDPAQLLNLLYGNSSLQPDLMLDALRLPQELRAVFPGPRFGVAGLRDLVDRPRGALTCTALKPVGLGPDELGGLCLEFARAGLDLIKDDHGLADHAFCPLEQRVAACEAAIERAADETGRRSLYVPNLLGTPTAVREQMARCRDAGVRAVMLTPMLLGMPFFHELVADLQMPVLAHPSLAGVQRFSPPALLGSLFRLFGADAVIYPHQGGRFAFSRQTCLDLAERLREQHPWARPSLPTPAGGMSVERAGDLRQLYGDEVMLLIGGSLYLAGDRLRERSQEFVQAVHDACEE